MVAKQKKENRITTKAKHDRIEEIVNKDQGLKKVRSRRIDKKDIESKTKVIKNKKKEVKCVQLFNKGINKLYRIKLIHSGSVFNRANKVF